MIKSPWQSLCPPSQARKGLNLKEYWKEDICPFKSCANPPRNVQLAPCHITANLIAAKLRSNYSENFQGGGDQAAVMLEAVHPGPLAQTSQHSASEGRAEVDTGTGQLALHRRDKMVSGLWLEPSSCSAVLPVPVFGIKRDWGKECGGLTFRQHTQMQTASC